MNGNRCAQLTYAELSGSVRKPYIIDIGALLIPVSSFSVTDTRLGILAAYKGEGNKTWPFQDPKPTRIPELLTEQFGVTLRFKRLLAMIGIKGWFAEEQVQGPRVQSSFFHRGNCKIKK